MKKPGFAILFCLSALTLQTVNAQNIEKQVEQIQVYSSEISAKTKAIEADDETGEYGDFVMNEIVINKRRHQWRAVGTYVLTFKFFYQTIGERLYPDQLVKAAVKKEISSRTYSEEFIYDKSGALIFYFQKAENDEQVPQERTVYFSQGKAIRIIEDDKKRDKLTTADAKTVREIWQTSASIKEIFTKSIKL